MACQRPSQIAHAGFLRFGMGTDPSPVRKIGHRGGNLDNNEVIYS